MQCIGTGIETYFAALGPDAARAMKRAQNKERYRAAVERTWRTNPEAARLVLAHTNGIAIVEDTRLRIGPDKKRRIWNFVVYIDDAVVRTELDACQFILVEALRVEGVSVDGLRIYSSKRDMRKRHVFPELVGQRTEPVRPAPDDQRVASEQSRNLDTFKRAVCVALGDTEAAWTILERVRGAELQELKPRGLSREANDVADGIDSCGSLARRRWWCHLHVEGAEEVQRVLDVHGEAIKAQANVLGLHLMGMTLHEAEPQLAGKHAFSRCGSSVSLHS